MKKAVYKISLDIYEHGSQAVLKAKKTDTGRKLHITLRTGGAQYIIEDDCYAVFKATKPDGSILYNACTIENNEIIYEFTEQTCTAVGRCRCEIALYGLGGNLITSPKFALLVDGTIYPDETVESTDEFSALTTLVTESMGAISGANQAAGDATKASQDAESAADNASKAAVAANNAANNASEAAVLANTSKDDANKAAKTANDAAVYATGAATAANNAANSANTAADGANEAKDNANLAAESAHKTATKVANTVKNFMVIGKAEGTNIALTDAIEQFFVGCRIFGKTTQDGTPTPDAPVELVSVGDSGSITVNVTGEKESQSMAVATPNGLPGIPVTSGGNYTDANGQQWVCDEIDFARGVYVQRISRQIVSNFKPETSQHGTRYLALGLKPTPHPAFIECLCSTLSFSDLVGKDVPFVESGIRVAPQFEGGSLVAKCGDMVLNDLDIMYIIATPIETPLSEEEVAAYAALHTYRDNTTVYNDAGAYMELEYVMDAKKYIDSLVSGSILSATVE